MCITSEAFKVEVLMFCEPGNPVVAAVKNQPRSRLREVIFALATCYPAPMHGLCVTQTRGGKPGEVAVWYVEVEHPMPSLEWCHPPADYASPPVI